jgi:threonine synthase
VSTRHARVRAPHVLARWKQENFEDALHCRAGEGFASTIEGELFRDELVYANFAGGEEADGGLESSAAGTDQRDLVHDGGGGIDGDESVDGGLHDDGPARDAHRDGGAETLGGTGGVDNEGVAALGQLLADELGGDPFDDAQLFTMASKEMHCGAVRVKDLGDQQPEFSVAQDGDAIAFGDVDLIQDLASGGNGFDEDCVFDRDGLRHAMQIAQGQSQEFTKCSGMLDDSKNSASGTMAAESARTPFAMAAGEIDFAGDGATDPGGIFGLGHFAHEFMAGGAAESVVAALQFEIRRTDSGSEHADAREAMRNARERLFANFDASGFEMNGEHRLKLEDMAVAAQTAELVCFNAKCRTRYAITDVLYNCTKCSGLLEAVYGAIDTSNLKKVFRERRMSNAPLDASGVWRYRELFPFLDDYSCVTTLREGNTPLLDAPIAAAYAGLDRITFKHQGFNPTGSFKDNGMTCGVAQARRLGMRRVACVSTGNTSASMAAYAAAAGIEALIFLPNGNISFGKLAQALEYGARTFEVEANFDQILALVRVLAERVGIYLLNSVNPFRIEGQKSIIFEMLDQRDWRAPEWIVLPGGNLGNTSAFGKALRELMALGLIDKMPRLAVVQAAGASPFYEFVQRGGEFHAVEKPETLATAIRIGDPVSWPKALHEVRSSGGVVEQVSEQEIADAKAQIGRCGIGCEPASAATLAGLKKLTARGVVDRGADVVAVLTGNLLKDPDYIYRYHTGQLEAPGGVKIESTYGNRSVVVPNDADAIARVL